MIVCQKKGDKGMNIIAWLFAVIIAIVAWKFLKGALKIIIFATAILIILWLVYPYIAIVLGNFN